MVVLPVVRNSVRMVPCSWFPDKTTVTFEDGPCAGMVIEAPARTGMPPLTLLVRPDGTDPRAGSDHDGSDGWVRYFGPHGRRRDETRAWVFVLDGVSGVPGSGSG